MVAAVDVWKFQEEIISWVDGYRFVVQTVVVVYETRGGG